MSETELRRKRVNRYKKIIIGILITIIILPSILCVILFCRMSGLSRELSEVKTSMKLMEKPNVISAEAQPQESSNGKPQSNANVQEQTSEVSSEPAAVPEVNSNDVAKQALAEGRKVVYLTFDDGPCDNTLTLLDVLDRYNVKATFFVIGTKGYEKSLNEIINRGHTLGMHSYTHVYSSVYESLDSFKGEINDIRTQLYNTTGVMPTVFRFPGGSSNSQTKIPIKTFIDYLNSENIEYYDWNVSSGDGADGLTTDQIYNNVMNGIAQNDTSVVLMHDAMNKKETFDAVPHIIESLQAMNAAILPITADTEPVHHNVN